MHRRLLLQGAAAAGLLARAGLAPGAGNGSLAAILAGSPSPILRQVLEDPSFELQVLLSRFQRRAGAWQLVAEDQLGHQPRRWFSAASFVKLPLAALLLEELSSRGVETATGLQLRIDPVAALAPLPEGIARGLPLASLLRSMLVISDNPAYNALHELFGSDELHRRLAERGYPDVRIAQRIGASPGLAPRKAAARLLDAAGAVVWDSPAAAQEQPQTFPYVQALRPEAWLEQGRLLPGPREVSRNNFLPLADVHRLMIELGSAGESGQATAFTIAPAWRRWLRALLQSLPRQHPDAGWDASRHPDRDYRYLFLDGRDRQPAAWRVASKIARSFGFIGESVYAMHLPSETALALSAVLFVDRDGVLNDARYAYDELGRPALRAIGEALGSAWSLSPRHSKPAAKSGSTKV